MKLLGKLLIFIAIIVGLSGIWNVWRSFKHANVIVPERIDIIKVEIFPVRSGLSTISYTGVFLRDGVIDTTKIKDTRSFTIKNPLPTLQELHDDTFYIHYVPKAKKHETWYPDYEPITQTAEYYDSHRFGKFIHMFVLLFIGYFLNRSKPKPHL